jgi:hypothetical protein
MSNRSDPTPFFIAAAAGVAAASQPAASLAAFDAALKGAIGHKLFTVLAVNLAANETQRYYSNMPDAYPVGGTKPILKDNAGMSAVITEGKCRINHDYAELSAAFFDHELIRSLGCESSVNVPVRWNGTTLGMLNILHESGYYSAKDIPTLSVFGALAVPTLLEIIRTW